MRLIIHMGPKKTGTTALQKYLSQNRQQLLTTHQICYPAPIFGGEAHHEISFGINYQVNGTAPYAEAQGFTNIPHPREMFQRYMEEATASNCQTILISSETLFELNEKQAETLRESTEGIDEIEYSFAVRDRVSLIVSRWQEEVKHGYTKSLSEYMEPSSVVGPNAADYYQKILDNRDVNKNLKVKPFMYSGYDGSQSVILEFLSSLGISNAILNPNAEEINVGIKSGPLLALMTANHWMETQRSLLKGTRQQVRLQPISRALDLREYVLKNAHLEGEQYSLMALLIFSSNKLDSFRKLNELVNYSLRDFQLAFPSANHDDYQQKLRTDIEETLSKVFRLDFNDFCSHVEKYKKIGVKLAEEFSAQI